VDSLTSSAERNLDLVVSGHVNIDHFLRVDRLPEVDRTVPLLSEVTVLGGTATTLARVASRRGTRVGLIARVGEDFPGEYRELLQTERVDIGGLETVPAVRSPCCYIIEDAAHHQVTLIHQGPMGRTRGARAPSEFLSRTRWLHLSTGEPGYQLRLRAVAKSMGVHFAVDPAQEIHYLWSSGPFRKLLDGAEILFGNESELRRACELLHVRQPRELLEWVPMIVLTRGFRGARAFTRAGGVDVPAQSVRSPKQVTGAGDAFRGGFYSAFLRGEPLRRSLSTGTREAASWIRHGGFGRD
jgi:ribokinase